MNINRMATRPVVLSFAALGFIVVGLLLFRLYSHDTTPIRPSAVPSSAVWGGGPDGGDWIDCRPLNDSTARRFFCTIYEDHSGATVYKGVFRLYGKSASLDSVRRLVGSYTGDEIILRDDRKLIAEIPIDSSSYEEMMSRDYEEYLRKDNPGAASKANDR